MHEIGTNSNAHSVQQDDIQASPVLNDPLSMSQTLSPSSPYTFLALSRSGRSGLRNTASIFTDVFNAIAAGSILTTGCTSEGLRTTGCDWYLLLFSSIKGNSRLICCLDTSVLFTLSLPPDIVRSRRPKKTRRTHKVESRHHRNSMSCVQVRLQVEQPEY
ncbi:hypothetical protein BKA93DRAFT_337403 [Sparassis latifolia]